MYFIAIAAAFIIAYIIQSSFYKKHSFDNLEYSVKTSVGEVFEGEDIFIYEEITNGKFLPLPYLRIDTTLPDGLSLIVYEKSQDGKRLPTKRGFAESVFVVKGNSRIRRRWRVHCDKRGVYTLGHALAMTDDIIGMNAKSIGIDCSPSSENRVVVLPRVVPLDDVFAPADTISGDYVRPSSLYRDPMRVCGSRDYTPNDPMRDINWKSSAVHGRLMVNIEEKTVRRRFNIIINMNSRDIEKIPTEPSMPYGIEQCITVAASIIDNVAAENVPVRLIINTPPESVNELDPEDSFAATGEDIGREILVTRPYGGREDMLSALRMLAQVQMKISVNVDKMLDYIAKNYELFTNGDNIIMVTSYINERFAIFHGEMAKHGVNVIFYITSPHSDLISPHDEIEKYYYYQ